VSRSPRLPNHARMRPSPGQLALFDRPTYTLLLPTGRTLQVLPGGRMQTPTPEPMAAGMRRAA
jgi:hypothetical protein